MTVQYTGHVIHVTTIPHCYWRKFWLRNTRLYRLYIRFGIILTQFYINLLIQEHQIDVLYVSFKTWDSQVSVYTPFHFSFTVPLIWSKMWKIPSFFESIISPLFAEKPQVKINCLNKLKHGYLIHIWLDKAFKGSDVNRALPSLHGGSLEFTLNVPLKFGLNLSWV